MDAPIGIFDSGIGGLTIAKALVERLPRESLYYVGDTAHMPYGDKSPERLNAYASGIAQRLTQAGCKALVVACNSASSNALDAVRKVAGPKVPVIGVVEPVVHWAQSHHPQGTLSLIGTRATVQSGVYQTRMKAHGLALRTRATPLLASAIEEGFHNGTIPEAVVKAYFADGWAQDTDGLVLACTHYPLAMSLIQAQLRPNMPILDAPTIVAAEVARVLSDQHLLSVGEAHSHRFEVTDWTRSFADGATHIMGSSIDLVQVEWSESYGSTGDWNQEA